MKQCPTEPCKTRHYIIEKQIIRGCLAPTCFH